MSNNILENVRLICFRGQLYEGQRNRTMTAGGFIFGDAEYFASSYADASTYAKSSISVNRDLVSNIEAIAKVSGESYADVRQRILSAGDGKVITTYLASNRMMVYGGVDGKQFFDISDEPLFRRRFDLALAEVGESREDRERLTDFVVKNNNDIGGVMAGLSGRGCTSVLRNFASICNCDAFKTHSSITPVPSILKNAGMNSEHIMVLDEAKIHVLRTDGEPVTICEEKLNSPNTPRDELIEIARDVLKKCDKIEWDIYSSVRFSVEVIAEGLKEQKVGGLKSQVSSTPHAESTPRKTSTFRPKI